MAPTGKNYYEILGVPREATKAQIKTAYKELSLIFHPDSNFYSEIVGKKGGQTPTPGADDSFRAVTEAYETLSDEAARAKYDMTLPPVMPDWEAAPINELGEYKAEKPLKPIHGTGMFGRQAPILEREEKAAEASSFISKLSGFFSRKG